MNWGSWKEDTLQQPEHPASGLPTSPHCKGSGQLGKWPVPGLGWGKGGPEGGYKESPHLVKARKGGLVGSMKMTAATSQGSLKGWPRPSLRR